MATQPFRGSTFSRRAFVGAGTAGVVALALAACTPSGSRSISTTAAAGRETVDFTSFQFGVPATEKPVSTVIDAFTKSEGIKVAPNAIPYANFLDQIVLKAKGGNVSGIAHIDEEWLSTLATAGVLKSTAKVFVPSRYPAAVKSAGSYRGQRYAMPWTQSGIGMIGNAEILRAAGVTTPIATIDDFTAALRAIKKSDSSITPYAPSTNVQQLKDIIPWMWTFGSTIYDGSSVTLGDTGSIKAIDYWKQLLDEGLMGDNLIRNDARTLFAQSRAAIYDDAPQAISVIPAQASDKAIASKMISLTRPTVKAGAGSRNLVWSQPLVAFDEDPSSFDLLTYLGTELSAEKTMFVEGGQPPTTNAALSTSWFTSNTFVNTFTKNVAAHATKNPFWSFPTASSAQNAFNEQVEGALKGTVSAKAAMSSAKQALEALL